MTERDTNSGATAGSSELARVRGVFEESGQADPMYAALSRKGLAGMRWDAEAFFANGRTEVADVLAYVAGQGVNLQRGRALDFGCAIGRLTQALGAHFDQAVGVDIAAAMVEQARTHNQQGERVTYVHNTAPHLHVFADHSFDFVYSNKVLQHIPPTQQLAYVREFLRVLRPGGLAVFQMRNGPYIEPGSVRASLYTLNRIHFRWFTRRVRGRRPYGLQMHFVARAQVERVVSEAGGRILDVVDLSRGKPNKSLRYCVTR
ncbi:MAG: class I SAM-dependent methyltransferase [Longimicrobiales bacterium]